MKITNEETGELRVRSKRYMMPDEEQVDLNQIGIKEATESRIVFRKMPILIWFAGLVIILSSLYLIYHLALGQLGVLFQGYRQGYWWQYLIAVFILGFGIIFMWAGKIDSVVIDKQLGIMTKERVNIVCKKKQTDWALDQIKNVRVFKRGHDSIQVVTIHFEVQVDFSNLPSCTLLETQSHDKAIKQAIKIKQFLGLPINKVDLKFIDESTSRFKKSNIG
mmetsp:Transcript_13346/g.22688  ORF Transcript_13346/g.22688 Transcript_13346/m.22688 type:complete len:220 (-) Transcript_13346:28-687(-)